MNQIANQIQFSKIELNLWMVPRLRSRVPAVEEEAWWWWWWCTAASSAEAYSAGGGCWYWERLLRLTLFRMGSTTTRTPNSMISLPTSSSLFLIIFDLNLIKAICVPITEIVLFSFSIVSRSSKVALSVSFFWGFYTGRITNGITKRVYFLTVYYLRYFFSLVVDVFWYLVLDG